MPNLHLPETATGCRQLIRKLEIQLSRLPHGTPEWRRIAGEARRAGQHLHALRLRSPR